MSSTSPRALTSALLQRRTPTRPGRASPTSPLISIPHLHQHTDTDITPDLHASHPTSTSTYTDTDTDCETDEEPSYYLTREAGDSLPPPSSPEVQTGSARAQGETQQASTSPEPGVPRLQPDQSTPTRPLPTPADAAMGVHLLGSVNLDPALSADDLELAEVHLAADEHSRPKTFANHQKAQTMKERELVLAKKLREATEAAQPQPPTPTAVTLESAAQHARVSTRALKLALLVAPPDKHQALLEDLSNVNCNWDPPQRYILA